jgi:hypothetical protein
LKLLSRIVRGQFSLGQTLQVIALGQKDTFPNHAAAAPANAARPNIRSIKVPVIISTMINPIPATAHHTYVSMNSPLSYCSIVSIANSAASVESGVEHIHRIKILLFKYNHLLVSFQFRRDAR